MAVARYLADKSAYARLHQEPVRRRLGPLIESGLVATCTLIDMEILFSTRTPREFQEVRHERGGIERLDMEQSDWDRAAEIQAVLASRGKTRAVGIPDLLLAALAERHRVTLLHYDRDFDVISALTSQPAEWIVAAGSVS